MQFSMWQIKYTSTSQFYIKDLVNLQPSSTNDLLWKLQTLKPSKKSLSVKGVEAVIAVINKGKHFGENKVMLDEVSEINDQAYAEVVRKSYGCDLQKLQNTFNFAKSYNKTGLRTILKEMESCNKSSDQMFCKIVCELEDKTDVEIAKHSRRTLEKNQTPLV
jgi:hypothetical protein